MILVLRNNSLLRELNSCVIFITEVDQTQANEVLFSCPKMYNRTSCWFQSKRQKNEMSWIYCHVSLMLKHLYRRCRSKSCPWLVYFEVDSAGKKITLPIQVKVRDFFFLEFSYCIANMRSCLMLGNVKLLLTLCDTIK